jgi:hypothetical protein
MGLHLTAKIILDSGAFNGWVSTRRARIVAARVAWRTGQPIPSAVQASPRQSRSQRLMAAVPPSSLPIRRSASTAGPARIELATVGQVNVKTDLWQRVTAIASFLSVLAVAAGLVVANMSNRDQQRLALQGQITDRLIKAVEQLGQPGPEKVDIRLGAIYSLQRIMRDSRDDQAAIVEILSAYVRVHTRDLYVKSVGVSGLGTHVMSEDVQASLAVLARRDPTRDGGGRVNASRSYLGGASLANAALSRADFGSAILYDADLRGANLNNADLNNADLLGANLSSADLGGANLHFADLRAADLGGARLHGADLSNADFKNANLRGVDLRGAALDGALRINCARVDQYTLFPPGFERSEYSDPDDCEKP